jgi:hypothetical protein
MSGHKPFQKGPVSAKAKAALAKELAAWPPIYTALVEKHGDPADIDPTPTVEALLARRPRK